MYYVRMGMFYRFYYSGVQKFCDFYLLEINASLKYRNRKMEKFNALNYYCLSFFFFFFYYLKVPINLGKCVILTMSTALSKRSEFHHV